MVSKKNELKEYLISRTIALNSAIVTLEEADRSLPEASSMNEAKKKVLEMILEEITNIRTICEKRGRF